LGVLLLLGFGWLVFSDGRLGHRIQTMPFEEAVVEVVDRQAWSHWPVVEERVLSMLAREEIDAVSHAKRVIHARPTRHPVGLALVKAGGSAHAVEAGFNPSGIIDSTLAVDLALELENAGNLGRAIALLRRHPRTGRLAFVLSYLAAAHGDDALCESAWRKGKVGGGVPLLPGSLVGPTHLYSGEPNEVLFVAEERLNELEIRAEGRSHLGQPELSLELDGRQVWGPQAVPSKGSVWVWKVAISPGAHRLSARLTNDLTGSGGDRNIHGLEIWAR